ncbi:hypothetical protein LJC67_06185, partial [Bacteroidales bacterium OttesenSCG-928-A14]|nr:hypothetical protein [Bacteroidales bacterium OttesenSCG-928-A14]
MKKYLSTTLLFFFLFSSLQSQNLKAILDYQVFCLEDLQPYLEITMIAKEESLTYVEKEAGFMAEVVFHVFLQDKNTKAYVDTFAYYLFSNPDKELEKARYDFGDTYREIIAPGDYIIHFSIKDLNNPEATTTLTDLISAHYPADQISVSEVNLLSSFSQAEPGDFFEKYGYNLVPKYNNFYPKEIDYIHFFMEIYNATAFFSKGEKVKVKTSIKNSTNKLLNLNPLVHNFEYDVEPVIILLDKFDIRFLPSGNYSLGVEIYDANENLKTSTFYAFQRSNPS